MGAPDLFIRLPLGCLEAVGKWRFTNNRDTNIWTLEIGLQFIAPEFLASLEKSEPDPRMSVTALV